MIWLVTHTHTHAHTQFLIRDCTLISSFQLLLEREKEKIRHFDWDLFLPPWIMWWWRSQGKTSIQHHNEHCDSFPCKAGGVPAPQLDCKLLQDRDWFLSASLEVIRWSGMCGVIFAASPPSPNSFLQFHLYMQNLKLLEPQLYSLTWVQALNLCIKWSNIAA